MTEKMKKALAAVPENRIKVLKDEEDRLEIKITLRQANWELGPGQRVSPYEGYILEAKGIAYIEAGSLTLTWTDLYTSSVVESKDYERASDMYREISEISDVFKYIVYRDAPS